jgi:hypothetical protein
LLLVSFSVLFPGSEPGVLNGALSVAGAFSTSRTIGGACNATYDFNGSFTGPNTFSGTLTATFTGSSFDCVNQSWLLNGTR